MTVAELKTELAKFDDDYENDMDIVFYSNHRLHEVSEICECVANIDDDYETEKVVIFSNANYNNVNTIVKLKSEVTYGN